MDEDYQLPNENSFRISKDAAGNPVYTHNNVALPKDVFDQRSQASTNAINAMDQASKNEINAMRNSVTPGFDDDPDMMAMQAKVQAKQAAIQAAKKPIKKAKGGAIKSSASRRGDGIAQRGKTKGRMC